LSIRIRRRYFIVSRSLYSQFSYLEVGMKVIIIAGILLLFACLAQLYYNWNSEGFQDVPAQDSVEYLSGEDTSVQDTSAQDTSAQDIPTEEVPIKMADKENTIVQDTVVQAAVQNATNVDELTLIKDLRVASEDANEQLKKAGGRDVVKKRLNQEMADLFDNAVDGINAIFTIIPENADEDTIRSLRDKRVDIVQFEPIIRSQINIVQKALVTPVNQPTVNRYNMPIANVAVEEPIEAAPTEESTVETTEGFASYQNPYNNPNTMQSYQFQLGKQAILNSVKGPLFGN